LLGLTVAAIAPIVAGAEDKGASGQTRLVEPQVVIAVQEVEGTGELVQMHYKGDVYDELAVKRAIEELAALTGANVERYQYMPAATAEEVNRVVFVTQNLIDASNGDIRLQPIVRAFMTGAKGKVGSLSVRILGMSPNPYTTLAAYNSKAVALRAFYDAATPSIEYRILVITDKPSEVDIPPRHIPDEMVTQAFEEPKKDWSPALLGLILLAGGSAGALVYFFLLGKRS
jgi:hypothetical protein